MTSEQIETLRRLHNRVIAQPWTVEQPEPIRIPRENAAFLVACNNALPKLLDEREALLEACRVFVDRAKELNAPMTAAEVKARQAIQKVEAP